MKTVKFYKSNDIVRVLSLDTETLLDELKPAIYTLCFSPMSGFYLQHKKDRFEVPSEIYGSANKKVNKVLSAYEHRSVSTGVMLTGDKGSGKTMLSSIVCNKMIDKGLPVILIEDSFSGSGFLEILDNIGESVLFFDEFGKTFAQRSDEFGNEIDNPQQNLLSLFDGANSTKRLIIITENETELINGYMKNRPGRLLYHFRYNKLEEDVIREYCKSKNIDDGSINELVYRRDTSFEFSFDVLKAIVEEYLRTGESIQEVCDDLNIERPLTEDTVLKIESVKKDGEVGEYFTETEYVPFNTRWENHLYIYKKEKEDIDYLRKKESVRISVKNIVKKNNDKLILKADGFTIEASSVIKTPTGYVSSNVL